MDDSVLMDAVGPECSSMLKRNSNATKERRMRLEKVGSYRVGRTLGRGNFAHVRIAYHEVANTKVAMKIVDRRTLDAENLVKIEREVEILQTLSHPSIVKLYEVIRTEKHIYIITEYISNGELFDMLMDKGRQTEDESRRLFQQIVSAVAYCHAKGVVHRDLKAENLLLDRKGNIKLIDFGFSNYQKTGNLLSTWCGSPPYAAPELLLAHPYDGRMSDVWSLGVILYILVTAGFPFPGDSVDKLKRAVLGDHLKIPFWVSVECADLIRKMLTVTPAKRCSLTSVMQHRWFTSTNTLSAKPNASVQLDPTVMLFMQQHTGWTEDQISEEVIPRNYESPIFATYELLRSKLDEFKEGDLQMENDQARRGSRGSILSGKANVEPETSATTIPAHHLAKLNLSTSPDYESEDSSASDIGASDDTSPRYHQQRSGGYKVRRRRGTRGGDQGLPTDERRHTLCATERHPQLNPLLSAAAQQFAVDTTRAWANAAAAAALQLQFASQLQQTHQQQLQQAALNLVSLQNFPFVDYARMMHVPNQERRASANEALLGMNGYAHLLAACSTMGVSAAGGTLPDRSASSASATHPSYTSNIQPRRSVEEEGESYLSQRGSSKRNTVHAGTPTGTSPFPTSTSLQRHNRTPYSKQNGGIVAPGSERRSSWASATPSAGITAGLNISAQQHAQLERLYRQSITTGTSATSAGNAPPGGTTESLSGVQQLQLEFQKLCATTKDTSPAPNSGYNSLNNALLGDAGQLKTPAPPSISITDENNRSLLPPSSSSYDPLSFLQSSTAGAAQQQSSEPCGNAGQFSTQSQQAGQQPRPATVIGFSSSVGPDAPSPTGQMINLVGDEHQAQSSPSKSAGGLKFVYVPVSITVALERLHRLISTHSVRYEVQPMDVGDNESIRIRVAPDDGLHTILELVLQQMPQSPNISRAAFSLVQGDASECDQLRGMLLSVFNEVY
ncbi:protein kinase domain-containing protein [Ditylenchus destructor]|nr:protein kinase domain-containing protein [Ditylenchus destructor]